MTSQRKQLFLQMLAVSCYGLGAVILQDDKPVAFASHTLSPAERHYTQIEKECLTSCVGM